MSKLSLQRAKEILPKHTTEQHLFVHAACVSAAMGAMADYFGDDRDHWEAIGWLHDVDYEKYPSTEEHCHHVREFLEPEGVDEEDIRSIISHGWGLTCDEVKPESNLEKSLFTVDELTGIIQACARMRPNGIKDLEIKSFMKKYKDKKFAAKCDRELIQKGCDLLGMEVREVAEICIEGMKPHAAEIGLEGTDAE